MTVLLPRNLAECFDALETPGARILAGGTDLLVRLRSGRETASTLVSLDHMTEVRGISETGASGGIQGGLHPH